MGMIALLISSAFFVGVLIRERLLLDRNRRSIPLRISVTGTRGKTSVTRLLAAILREDGRSVLAKTTGSQPLLLERDGTEREIHRRGLPSIIEQTRLIRRAARKGIDSLIVEVMSLHPENHFVESQRIIQPNMVIITNVRRDHIDAMGNTEEEIAQVLSLDIPAGASVLVPAGENRPCFQEAAGRGGGRIREVAVDAPGHHDDPFQHAENLALVRAAAVELGVAESTVARGIESELAVSGRSTVWCHRGEDTGRISYFVDGFSANDPESSLQLVDRVQAALPEPPERSIALLAFRTDRADRTVQWVETLRSDASARFDDVYVTGAHAHAVRRRVPGVRVLVRQRPGEVTDSILSDSAAPFVLYGLGNAVGPGQELIDHWQSRFEPHEF